MTNINNLNVFSNIVNAVKSLLALTILAIISSNSVSAEEVSKHHSAQKVPSTLTNDDNSSDFEVIQEELSKIDKNTEDMSEASSAPGSDNTNTNNVISAEVMREMGGMQQSKKMMMKKEHHSAPMKKKMGMMMKTMMGRKPSAMFAQENDIEDLPGDSNVPHLYHLGEIEFFLDYVNTISLRQQQIQQLDKIRQVWLSHNDLVTKDINELEEKLWLLTAEGKPDANKIEAQIRHISKLQSNLRIDFIRSVGKAVSILTADQIKALASSNPTDS